MRVFCEMGFISVRNGPFRGVILGISGAEMGHIRGRNGPFRRAIRRRSDCNKTQVADCQCRTRPSQNSRICGRRDGCMSGIATMTNKYVKRIEGTKTHILDTRKTTPGMRILEKQAVRIGGGMNHRIGLFDMILLKDNHIDFAGGIENAINRCHEYLKEKNLDLKIEIEVRSFDELNQVISHGGVNRIMLDNFSVEDTKKAVEIINGRYETESSGGITYDTIRSYAECGVDFISVGALTHSVKCLDMSFKAC